MRKILTILLVTLHSLSVTAQLSVPDIKTMPGENAATLKQSGTSGTPVRIVIRCQSTIQSGNEPLYVVDGIVYESSQIKSINPNDIERIDVLKDAAASAIYGCRASHGVIIITTKKANEKKFIIKDSKDRVGVGFATITATSLKTGDSVSFVANEFGRIETGLLKSLDYKVKISCAGFKTTELSLRDIATNRYEILLQRDVISIKEVTVVGYISRRCCCCNGSIKVIKDFGKPAEESFTKTESVKVYPNPVSPSGTINISFPNVKEGLYQIRLTGSSGQLIYSCQKRISNKNQTEQIHLTAQTATGIYLLQVVDSHQKTVQSSKLIVQ